ncbi:MAG: peptidoglycan DD-metalloendopeptidase family protein [Hyphomicrobiaceae bacterium]
MLETGSRQSVRARMLPLACLACILPSIAYSAGNTPTPEEVRAKLEMRRQELESAKERAKFIQGDLVEIKQEREKLNLKLQETAAQIQKTEGRLTASEGKLADQEGMETALRADLEKNSGRIAKLMAALQRIGRNPPPVLYTQRADALQMVRSAMLLANAFPELRKDALALAAKLNHLIEVTTAIRNERDALKTDTANLADARTRMQGLLETKKHAQTERQTELAQVRATAAELSKNVTDLNDLIAKLDAAVTAATPLGAYDAEARAKMAATPQATMPSATPESAQAGVAAPSAKPNDKVAILAPPAPPKPSVVELAPASLTLGGKNPGRIEPAIPFHKALARLPQPAQGRRALAFGDKTQYGGQSKGIVIETRQNAQITSPCDGWIIFAGEFRSYGQLLIINAGNGYHVLLAGLSQIDVQLGQFVLAAEPVGTMGGTAAAQGKTSNSPVLYVEFRKDGRPIDPDPWWVGGHQKVQG